MCATFSFKNNHFTEMCSGSETVAYLRLIDSCITQLKAQGPSRTCNESKEEEEEHSLDSGLATRELPRELCTNPPDNLRMLVYLVLYDSG